MSSGSAQDPVNLDFDSHSVRVLTGGAVTGFEGFHGFCDSARSLVHSGVALESEPAPPIDLGDSGPSVSLDVSHLLGSVGADYPHPALAVVVAKGDRHDVRGSVFANRGECSEASFGEELDFGLGQVCVSSRHGRRRYPSGH